MKMGVHAGETHFHITGFAQRLVLTQEKKGNLEKVYCLKSLNKRSRKF